MSSKQVQTDYYHQIIEVSLELFSQYGYDGVKTSEVARLAGTSRPAIHYHFKNKQALWEATMLELTNRVESHTHFMSLMDSGLAGLDGLKRLYRSLIRVHVEVPQLGKIIFREAVAESPRLDWLGGAMFSNVNQTTIRLIEESIKAGEIKPYQPTQIRMLMDGAAVTYFNLSPYVYSLYGQDVFHPKNVKDFETLFFDVILDGLVC